MTKYTTTSLIKKLEKFPANLPIETELACLFNYDSDKAIEETAGKEYDNEEELFDVHMKYATELAIFEGSWEEDNISDLEGIMPKYVSGWIPSYHCNDHAILKEDIMTVFCQLMVGILPADNPSIVNKERISVNNRIRGKALTDFMVELGLKDAIEDIDRKMNAQKKMCEEDEVPLFAPEDGLCGFCGKQIYNRISMEKAEKELITHCPYCSMAYND